MIKTKKSEKDYDDSEPRFIDPADLGLLEEDYRRMFSGAASLDVSSVSGLTTIADSMAVDTCAVDTCADIYSPIINHRMETLESRVQLLPSMGNVSGGISDYAKKATVRRIAEEIADQLIDRGLIEIVENVDFPSGTITVTGRLSVLA